MDHPGLGRGIERGLFTLVCVILCNNIRIDIKWERSPVNIISSSILKKGILSHTQNPKNIHDGQRNASASSLRRATDEGVDSCSASAAWSSSESMASLMVLAVESFNEDVEDTQRRDFSQGCIALGALTES
jgi:hypothetical protein